MAALACLAPATGACSKGPKGSSGRGTTNGTPVIIWACNGQTNQQWTVNSNGSITNVLSGLCLDVTGLGTANGTNPGSGTVTLTSTVIFQNEPFL